MAIIDVTLDSDGRAISEVSNTIYLSVDIDTNWTWNKYMNNIDDKLPLVTKTHKMLIQEALFTKYSTFRVLHMLQS